MTVRGAASIAGVETTRRSAGTTLRVSTPTVCCTAVAGKTGRSGAAATEAIRLTSALGGGDAIAPLIGAAIVARPRAPAMPTCGALSWVPPRLLAAARRAALREPCADER